MQCIVCHTSKKNKNVKSIVLTFSKKNHFNEKKIISTIVPFIVNPSHVEITTDYFILGILYLFA